MRSHSAMRRSLRSPGCSAKILPRAASWPDGPHSYGWSCRLHPARCGSSSGRRSSPGCRATEQSGLLALAVLGSGSDSEVAAVAGEEIDIDRLMGSVPLLYQDAQGRFGAHQLWEDAVERIFPAAQIADVRRRALQTLRERGETVRMGSAAARWQDADMFGVACVSLVLESLGALPIDTAARWLASTPPGAAGAPEQQLLERSAAPRTTSGGRRPRCRARPARGQLPGAT